MPLFSADVGPISLSSLVPNATEFAELLAETTDLSPENIDALLYAAIDPSVVSQNKMSEFKRSKIDRKWVKCQVTIMLMHTILCYMYAVGDPKLSLKFRPFCLIPLLQHKLTLKNIIHLHFGILLV